MVILETRDLKKQYGTGETAVHALAGVNLSVENGEFVAVVGTSGSGKSTLLHMLGGLDRATSGKVYVDGKDIFALKDEELTIFRRRKIGFVFQSFNLVPVSFSRPRRIPSPPLSGVITGIGAIRSVTLSTMPGSRSTDGPITNTGNATPPSSQWCSRVRPDR